MTLRHMKIFITVYQYNSITRAAEKLHIAQPSVSLCIKELEEYYGIKLFDRISRRIYRTENGKKFYDYALHVVSLLDEMEQEIRNWDSFGTLRVGTSITIGNFILPKIIKEFYQLYPEIKVSAVIKNTSTIEEYVVKNEIDLALIEGMATYSQIEQIPFMEDRLCLICGVKHALAKKTTVKLKELVQYDFLLRESGSAGREILESIFLCHQIYIKPIWESISTQAIMNGVKEGLGISVLPYLLVEEEIKQKRVSEIKVEDVDFSRKFFIIYHKHKYLTESAKAFIEICKRLGNGLV